MKITAQEEYGLRIMLEIARQTGKKGITISEISGAEGLSEYNVAKLCRILRIAGFIESIRGPSGGYALARSAKKIIVNDVLGVLGGRLYNSDFCSNHSGILNICTNSVDCSIRSLWGVVQYSIDQILDYLTLQDLIASEEDVTATCMELIDDKLVLDNENEPYSKDRKNPLKQFLNHQS